MVHRHAAFTVCLQRRNFWFQPQSSPWSYARMTKSERVSELGIHQQEDLELWRIIFDICVFRWYSREQTLEVAPLRGPKGREEAPEGP